MIVGVETPQQAIKYILEQINTKIIKEDQVHKTHHVY